MPIATSTLGLVTGYGKRAYLPGTCELANPREVLALDALRRHTTHMTRLVEDLLDVSRVSRGDVSLRREAVDLQTIFSSAVEMDLALVQSRKHCLDVTQLAATSRRGRRPSGSDQHHHQSRRPCSSPGPAVR